VDFFFVVVFSLTRAIIGSPDQDVAALAAFDKAIAVSRERYAPTLFVIWFCLIIF
jgi:hypothetical protein